MDCKTLIVKIKKRRAVLLTASIIIIVALVVGSMTFTRWVNGEEVYVYQGPIPASTSIVLLLVLLIAVYFVSVLNETKIAELYNKECRPEAYLEVKVALCPKRKQNSEAMRYVKMLVANALGDYANSEALAHSLVTTKNPEIRLATLVCLRNVGFARSSVAECEHIMQTLDSLLSQNPKDGMRKKIEETRKTTLVALCLLQGQGAEAAAIADEIALQNETVSEVSIAYYQGLAYLAAGDRAEDAFYAFLTVQKKGGSVCYVEKSLPLLEQAREQLAKKNNTIE